MNEKGSRKEKRNVSEGRERRSRNGKNERVCRGCEEAGDGRMIALEVQNKKRRIKRNGLRVNTRAVGTTKLRRTTTTWRQKSTRRREVEEDERERSAEDEQRTSTKAER